MGSRWDWPVDVQMAVVSKRWQDKSITNTKMLHTYWFSIRLAQGQQQQRPTSEIRVIDPGTCNNSSNKAQMSSNFWVFCCHFKVTNQAGLDDFRMPKAQTTANYGLKEMQQVVLALHICIITSGLSTHHFLQGVKARCCSEVWVVQ